MEQKGGTRLRWAVPSIDSILLHGCLLIANGYIYVGVFWLLGYLQWGTGAQKNVNILCAINYLWLKLFF